MKVEVVYSLLKMIQEVGYYLIENEKKNVY